MNYKEIAKELLSLQADFLHLPIGISISEISEGEYFAMRLLTEEKSPSTPSAISKTMKVSMARVSALLRHLEEKKLIKKEHSDKDERRVSVLLTDEGRRFISEKTEAAEEKLSEILKKMGEKDAAEYVRLRKKILMLAQKKEAM